MKMKTVLIGASAFAIAGALFAGVSYAAQNDSTAPAPSEPVATSTPSPTPTLLTEPSPTPTPTETATPTPEPTTEPAPVAPAPKPAPVAKNPPPAPAPTTAIERNWPKFIPMDPQPANSPMPEGYKLTADGTIWYLGCGENDTSCSWSTN